MGDVEHNLYIFHEAAQLNFGNEIAHVYPGSVLIQTKTSFEFCNDTARDCEGVSRNWMSFYRDMSLATSHNSTFSSSKCCFQYLNMRSYQSQLHLLSQPKLYYLLGDS